MAYKIFIRLWYHSVSNLLHRHLLPSSYIISDCNLKNVKTEIIAFVKHVQNVSMWECKRTEIKVAEYWLTKTLGGDHIPLYWNLDFKYCILFCIYIQSWTYVYLVPTWAKFLFVLNLLECNYCKSRSACTQSTLNSFENHCQLTWNCVLNMHGLLCTKSTSDRQFFQHICHLLWKKILHTKLWQLIIYLYDFTSNL
jgi:hypothetical protein